jgi:hypothetical protein
MPPGNPRQKEPSRMQEYTERPPLSRFRIAFALGFSQETEGVPQPPIVTLLEQIKTEAAYPLEAWHRGEKSRMLQAYNNGRMAAANSLLNERDALVAAAVTANAEANGEAVPTATA